MDDRPRDPRWEPLIMKYDGAVTSTFFREHVHLTLGQWRIQLDEPLTQVRGATLRWSRVRAEVVNPRGLWFKANTAYPIHRLRARLSRHTVQVDDPEFDAAFFVRGNDADAIRTVFDSADLRAQCLRSFHTLYVLLPRPGRIFGRGRSTLTVKAVRPHEGLEPIVAVTNTVLGALRGLGLRPGATSRSAPSRS